MNTPKGRIATPFYFGESEITYYLLLLQTRHLQHHRLVCRCFARVVAHLAVVLFVQVFVQLRQGLEVWLQSLLCLRLSLQLLSRLMRFQ